MSTNKKKIIMYPSGTVELPSSHLRIYETAKELSTLGHDVVVVDPNLSNESKRIYLELAESGAIVYIQKMAQSFHKPQNFIPYKNKFTIVYDVDDFHNGQDSGLVEIANIVVAGSHYVADYCRQINKNVYIACSITDTEIYKYVDRTERPASRPLQIIWTENFANAYMEDLILIQKAMQRIRDKYKVRFVLQGLRENRFFNKPNYKNLLVKFIQMFPYAVIQKSMPIEQYLQEGVQTLFDSDIGIIPFKVDRVGKAGQNMRSLMSTGLACIGTPGNEHEHIIDHGKTGFLASTETEWEAYLEQLILNKDLRLQMGRAAGGHIRNTYSRKKYVEKICDILHLSPTVE